MKNLENVIALCCFIFLISCAHESDKIILKKGTAIVTGKVENWQEGSKIIRLSGSGSINQIEQTTIIDSLGNFSAEIEMFHPQDVHLIYEKGYAALFIQPSDSLFLSIDVRSFKNEEFPLFKISGLSKQDVTISENIRDYFHFRGRSTFYPNAKNKTVEEFLGILKQEIIMEDSILQIFCKANKTTPEFRNWAKNDIKYGVANYLLVYRVTHQGNYKGNLFDKELFPVENDAAIVTSIYGYHLRHYALNLGIWRDSISIDLLKNKEYLLVNKQSLDKILKEEKQGLSRDIMCYKMMLDLYNNSFADYVTSLKDVDTYIDNRLLIEILQEKKIDFEAQKDRSVAFLDTQTKEEKEILGDFWGELSLKYKGKIVYVDIWATWCGPCQVEIPHAIDLQEFYKGKEIVFVNLCLASDKSEWEKMIVNSNIHGDNYFFNKPQTQLLRDKLKFEGYPTYMIIDKDGNLIDKNAPRPSSGDEIKDILNKLLK